MRYSIIVLITIWVAACQTAPVEEAFTEKGNFKYLHHIKNGGPTPQGDELVKYHYCMRSSEKTFYCSRDDRTAIEMSFPSATGTYSSPLPTVEAARMMSVGDSMTLFYPLPTNRAKPKGFEKEEFLIYDIVVVDILPKEKNELLKLGK